MKKDLSKGVFLAGMIVSMIVAVLAVVGLSAAGLLAPGQSHWVIWTVGGIGGVVSFLVACRWQDKNLTP